jgi:4-coumarate--CoA ligase
VWDFVSKIPEVILPRFEPETFAQSVEKYKISVGLSAPDASSSRNSPIYLGQIVCVVPPILVTMSFHPVFDKYDMSTLKLLASAAAPLGESLVIKVLARFTEMGCNQLAIIQGCVHYSLAPEICLTNPYIFCGDITHH